MGAEVIPISALTKPTMPVCEDLVSGLEALLALAKDGSIQGIAYTTVQTPGAGTYTLCGTGWRGHLGGVHIALGGLALLQSRLIAQDDVA
jgi:hypothetical protein